MSKTTFQALLYLAAVFLLGHSVHAQPSGAPNPRALNLSRIVEEIRANNPILLQRRMQTEALRTVGRQASALPDPQFMVTAMPEPIYTAKGFQRSQFRLEQPIPFPGKLGLMGRIADLGGDAAAVRTAAAEDDLILEGKQAYIELYRVQRQKDLIDEFQHRLRDFEAIARTRYEVGEGSQQAILKAQLERGMLATRDLTLDRARIAAREQLARLLNRDVDTTEVSDLPAPSGEYGRLDPEELISMALDERPEARALVIDADRADARIDLADRQFYPDFGLNLTYFDLAPTDMPPGADGKNALAVGFSVKIPLHRDRLHAGKEEARVMRNSVDAELEALTVTIRTRIRALTGTLVEDDQQLSVYRDVLIPQAETSLAATVSAYTTGRTDFLNLLDAERMLFELRAQLEETTAAYLRNVAMLERAVGVDFLQSP